MNNELKQRIMDEIERKAVMFERKSNTQFRIRCPLCGDSDKNPRDMHCYIKCDYTNPDEKIKYNCFLCNRSGRNINTILKALNADQNLIRELQGEISNMIGSLSEANINVLTDQVNMDSPQVKFIRDRLGDGFTESDYTRFRIVWNMDDVRKYITSQRLLNTLPNNTTRINFMSDNKSMLISRSFLEDQEESQWRKVPIFQNYGPSFYIIQSTLDLFTSDIITVHIAEGIMDILSAYKNFNTTENAAFIAALGKDYVKALDYMMRKGFIGKNIIVRIYIDWEIDIYQLFMALQRYRWLFKQIKVYKNAKYKDIGVNVDKIKLVEVKNHG